MKWFCLQRYLVFFLSSYSLATLKAIICSQRLLPDRLNIWQIWLLGDKAQPNLFLLPLKSDFPPAPIRSPKASLFLEVKEFFFLVICVWDNNSVIFLFLLYWIWWGSLRHSMWTLANALITCRTSSSGASRFSFTKNQKLDPSAKVEWNRDKDRQDPPYANGVNDKDFQLWNRIRCSGESNNFHIREVSRITKQRVDAHYHNAQVDSVQHPVKQKDDHRCEVKQHVDRLQLPIHTQANE